MQLHGTHDEERRGEPQNERERTTPVVREGGAQQAGRAAAQPAGIRRGALARVQRRTGDAATGPWAWTAVDIAAATRQPMRVSVLMLELR